MMEVHLRGYGKEALLSSQGAKENFEVNGAAVGCVFVSFSNEAGN